MASSHAELQASHALLVEAEAQTASGARLLVQRLSVAPLHLLVDVHAAGGSRHIPITVDTHRLGQENGCASCCTCCLQDFDGLHIMQ